jgi:hypothetical protein
VIEKGSKRPARNMNFENLSMVLDFTQLLRVSKNGFQFLRGFEKRSRVYT